jgi:hypothetical protein
MSLCGKCGARVSEPARCLNGHAVSEQRPIQVEGFAELIAQKVKVLLAEEFRVAAAARSARSAPDELIGVREMAHAAGMSERWVYDHALELCGVKMGTTKRARWRFDRDRALTKLAELRGEGVVKAGPAAKPDRRELPADVELLPVNGRAA